MLNDELRSSGEGRVWEEERLELFPRFEKDRGVEDGDGDVVDPLIDGDAGTAGGFGEIDNDFGEKVVWEGVDGCELSSKMKEGVSSRDRVMIRRTAHSELRDPLMERIWEGEEEEEET